MKRLVVNILIIVAIVLIAHAAIGAALDAAICHVPDAGSIETDERQALFDRTPDILLLGSSRTKHSYDPQVFTAALGGTCYNAGMDGHSMVYSMIVLENVAARRAPRVVVLDVMENMINGDWTVSGMTDVMCYYGKSDPVTRFVNNEYSRIDRTLLHNNLIRLNGTLPWLGKAYLKGNHGETNGFVPYNGFTPDIMHKIDATFTPAIVEVKALDRIVNLCRQHAIKLYLFTSPNYEINTAMNEWLASYCSDHNLPYWDFSFDERFDGHPELFIEASHLNGDGAALYSDIVVGCIKPSVEP